MRFFLPALLLTMAGGCGGGAEGDPVEGGDENSVQMGVPSAGTPPGQPSYAPKPRPGIPEDCPLVVDFSSYGTGIDLLTYEAVLRLLESDASRPSIERYPWGREGEVSLCVTPRTAADAERLFHGIKALFPPASRFPLRVATRSGLVHEARYADR